MVTTTTTFELIHLNQFELTEMNQTGNLFYGRGKTNMHYFIKTSFLFLFFVVQIYKLL